MSSIIDRRPQLLDILIQEGDSVELEVTVEDEAGDPIDLSTHVISAGFKMKGTKGVVTPFTVTVSGVDNNIINLSLSPEDTENKCKDNVWDCQISDALGIQKSTILTGRLVIDPDITKV